MNISLFALVLLIIIPTNLMAQETTTQTSERNDKWLKKQDIHLKDEVTAYEDRNPSEETFELIQLSEPFIQQFDFNEIVREKMAWDKKLSREKSYLDRCRLSLGVIKVDKVMGGAMLKVKLFD
ncbi:MAG: hypothetical protein WBD99_07795 [Thermodesulfobacteriota bacterium]